MYARLVLISPLREVPINYCLIKAVMPLGRANWHRNATHGRDLVVGTNLYCYLRTAPGKIITPTQISKAVSRKRTVTTCSPLERA